MTGARTAARGRAYLEAALPPDRFAAVAAYLDGLATPAHRKAVQSDLLRHLDDRGHLDYTGDEDLIAWAGGIAERSGRASGRRALYSTRRLFVELGEAPPLVTRLQWPAALARPVPAPQPPPRAYDW